MSKTWMMIAVLLTAALAFSGSSTPAHAQDAGPLAQMLNQIPDNQVSRTVIWYGSLSDFERVLGFQLNSAADLQKLSQQQRAAYLIDVNSDRPQIYYSPFSGTDRPDDWQRTFGINPFTIEREVTVGATPKWYGVLQGQFDPAAVTQALQGLGYKGSGNILSLGGDNSNDPNNAANKIAGPLFDRVIVTANKIIAAPSTDLIQAAANGNPLGNDAGYKALVRMLEGSGTIPNTTLLSAALYNGAYLSDTVITGNQPANEKLLPRYQVAGVGYRRDASNRYWLITLVYTDANAANTAKTILADRLPRYVSVQPDQVGRKLFQGWKIAANVTPVDNFQVVTVSMQLPAQTDISLTELIEAHDIGFLATAR